MTHCIVGGALSVVEVTLVPECLTSSVDSVNSVGLGLQLIVLLNIVGYPFLFDTLNLNYL